MVRGFALRQDGMFNYPPHHPALPEHQAAVVGRRLSRLEQACATRFQMPAEDGHQQGIYRTPNADRDSSLVLPVDRKCGPFHQAGSYREETCLSSR